MPAWELAAWVVTLAAAIVGIAAKDWRPNVVALACAVFVLVMMVAHAR